MDKNHKRRVLFVERDGVLIRRHKSGMIDSMDKLGFYPNVLKYLPLIAKLNFVLVMISQQDGLGTMYLPVNKFLLIQNHVLDCLSIKGVRFDDVIIDRSLPNQNTERNVPDVALFQKYLDQKMYDMERSFVVGSRMTDVKLAKDIGCKAIVFNYEYGSETKETGNLKDHEDVIVFKTMEWRAVYGFLMWK